MIGYIYQLYSAYTDNGLYVGSTTNFTDRKKSHKSYCNNENTPQYNCKLCKYIRDYGGWSNWLMLIVEEFEYKDKVELREREQYWINELKANLNINGAVRNVKKEKETKKKWSESNKVIRNESSKKYYEKNKEKISKQYSQQFNCECGGKYTRNHKSQHIKTKKHQAYLQ